MFQSIVARKKLGVALKAARLAAGLSTTRAAAVLGRNQSTLSRIETAKAPLTPQDLTKLARAYGIGDSELAELQVLLEEGRSGERWWDSYNAWLPPTYAEMIAIENEADSVTAINLSLMPGLLQTEEYARAVFARSPLMMDPDRADALTEIRLRRQRRLEDADPIAMTSIITESVLRFQYGDGRMHHRQLLHLREMCGHPQVVLRVVPDALMIDLSALDVFGFADGTSVVYPEAQLTTLPAIEKHLEIRLVNRMIRMALEAAATPEESVSMIDRRLDGPK